jgi:hypothetical protein
MIGESALKTIKEKEQHEEKEKRAAELIIADKELVFQRNIEQEEQAMLPLYGIFFETPCSIKQFSSR